jgi:hypothetical protein
MNNFVNIYSLSMDQSTDLPYTVQLLILIHGTDENFANYSTSTWFVFCEGTNNRERNSR